MRARGVLMSKTKIVVIDNDKKAVWELSKSLECEENIEVVSVEENGIDGLEAINKYNPDIVIMELLLTGIDGFSIIDYIKECKYDIKIILTSVINQQNIVREAFDKGIDYFVVKPYDVNTIVNRVKRIIGENKNSDSDLKNKFCVNLDKGRKRPTNSEFIATMSQYIINSYR